MIRYVIEYTVYTTGSLGGRDDGYPYTKKKEFEDIESFLKALKTSKGIERYYAENVSTLSDKELDKKINEFEHFQSMQKAYSDRKKKEERLKQIKIEQEALERELQGGV